MYVLYMCISYNVYKLMFSRENCRHFVSNCKSENANYQKPSSLLYNRPFGIFGVISNKLAIIYFFRN